MAKVTFMDRENVLREYEITEDVVTVGREATNKLVIADPSVSRGHATIERREDGFYLVDKNSSNGTFVNGKKINQQKLNHKDKVNFGSASIVFEDEEQEGATLLLPRVDIPEPPKAMGASTERPTDALMADEVSSADEIPLPPPPPLVSGPKSSPSAGAVAPQPPAPAPPPPPPPMIAGTQPDMAPAAAAASGAAKPDAEVGVLCPSCRKVVESGARFCGFCGTPLAPKPAAPAPAPPPKPAPAAPPPQAPPSAKMSMPAPPSAPAPAPPKAAPAPPPPAPKPAAPMAPASPSLEHAKPIGTMNYAGFVPRLIAHLIDSIILTVIAVIPIGGAMLVTIPMQSATGEPSVLALAILGVASLITFVAVVGYMLYFIGAKGATIGKKMMKLRVTFPDGQYPIGYGKALVRMLVQMFLSGICLIGYIMILLDKEQHRALHDRIAGTVVLKEA